MAGPAAACLKLVEDDQVELFLSAPILAEVRNVLTRPKLQRKFPILTQSYVDTLLQALVSRATIIADPPQQFTYERDPKDEPYINLAIAASASYLVSRDNDLLDLMRDRTFCVQFPALTILDPVSFLQINRDRSMLPDKIATFLRMIYNFPAETRIDITLTGEGSFQATAVALDRSTEAIDGTFRISKVGEGIMIAPLQQPDLTLEQLKVYDEILGDFTRKLGAGEEQDLAEIQLMQEGDYPELFDVLGDHPSIAASVKIEMLPAWHSLDHMLRIRGYRAIKRLSGQSARSAILAEKHSISSFP